MEKGPNKRKMVAPIVITVVLLIYVAGYVLLLLSLTKWSFWVILPAIPMVGIGVGLVLVLKQRIKEIRSGEEDDLDNY